MSAQRNRQITLVSRPQGLPTLANFRIVEGHLPAAKNGEVVIQTVYLSVDPYMRNRMNESSGYISAFQIGHPLTGGVVGKVIESKSPSYKPGDFVLAFSEWADFSAVSSNELQKLDSSRAPLSTALGILGMPGMTAYFGLLDIGKPKPDETVVVSAAAGIVGSIVGQIAKIKGCRVVGLAGSDAKIDYLVHELKFDHAINYKKNNFADLLREATPNGVDVYFDNVGGDITDHVLHRINRHARIVVCGQISMYNASKPDIGPRNLYLLLINSALAKGFIVDEYEERFPEGIRQLSQWLQERKIKYRENIIEGLENAPNAFLGLFSGDNIGKQLVKVS